MKRKQSSFKDLFFDMMEPIYTEILNNILLEEGIENFGETDEEEEPEDVKDLRFAFEKLHHLTKRYLR